MRLNSFRNPLINNHLSITVLAMFCLLCAAYSCVPGTVHADDDPASTEANATDSPPAEPAVPVAAAEMAAATGEMPVAAEDMPAVAGEMPDAAAEIPGSTKSVEPTATSPEKKEEVDEEDNEEPFEFSPYKILVWVASDDVRISASSIEVSLRQYLDREYSSIWRLTIEDAPTSLASSASRDLGAISYETLTSTDPVVAIKKDHKDAIRLRVAANVREYITKIYGTSEYIESIKQRGAEAGDATLTGVAPKMEAVDGDMLAVQKLWADEKTEALLLPRGFAATLTEPESKTVELPVSGLIGAVAENYDKIFIVNVQSDTFGGKVSVVEYETLMRYFGSIVTEQYVTTTDAADAIGYAMIQAFSPEVRIDDAGLTGAQGLVRASGLILDPTSDALVNPGDMLLPFVRKNDRNGRPILIGPMDWAYLLAIPPQVSAFPDGFRLDGTNPVKIPVLANDIDPKGGKKTVSKLQRREAKVGESIPITDKARVTLNKDGTVTFIPEEDYEGPTKFSYTMTNGESSARATVTDSPDVPETKVMEAKAEESGPDGKPMVKKRDHTQVKMEFYSGRPGGLQGRANKRTFKRGLRIRPTGKQTMVRLHAKGKPDAPLVGYELYQKELYGKSMTFVGRTDWDGRIAVEKTDDPLRLLYVKNGGAVLARLPLVPGFTPAEVADLKGDDTRLQAEAFVNGINNSIVDLVAVRKLLGNRIRSRLKKGQMKEAKELLLNLREQPTKDLLAGELDAKEKYFTEEIGVRQANAYRKVKDMFGKSKEMLAEQISQKFIREIEEDYIRAESNGGRLPKDPEEEDKYDASANVVKDDKMMEKKTKKPMKEKMEKPMEEAAMEEK